MTGPLLTHDGTVHGTGNDDPRTHIDVRHPAPQPTGDDSMTDAQFQEIKALLEKLLEAAQVNAALSQIFLDQHKAQQAAATAQPAPGNEPTAPAAA